MSLIRVDKLLANLNYGSRKEIKKLVSQKRIKIDDKIVLKPEEKYDTEKNKLYLDNNYIRYEEYEYYMLNKPKGYISATEDNIHKTVMELIPNKLKGLAPIGRLDIDTEGFLLVSNDGKLAHKLISPSNNVPKEYYADIEGTLPDDVVNIFEKGMPLDEDFTTKPAKLKIISKDRDFAKISLIIYEGKFHQVKRMFEHVNCKVRYLKRTSFASIVLDEKLEIGSVRKLTQEELDILRSY